MTGYLYDKDLSAMKYAILTSTRHDRVVRVMAEELNIPQIKLRKWMMDHFDMMLLENLPARYDQARRARETEPPIERDLGAAIYTRAIPLLSEAEMERVKKDVYTLVHNGIPEKEAVNAGRKMIREVILP
jgi:energy-converting hydrogenase A subunit M